MSQLDLITGEPVAPPRDHHALTDRQQRALEYVGKQQPVSSDELGAFLHEDRMRRGGKGHGRDERCEYCAGEGREMGEALKRHGRVVRKKTIGWVLPDYRAEPVDVGFEHTGFPEGF